MKTANIYTFENAKEAEKLIGKKVIVSDYYGLIVDCPEDCSIMVLAGVIPDSRYYPFWTRPSDSDLTEPVKWQFIRELGGD